MMVVNEFNTIFEKYKPVMRRIAVRFSRVNGVPIEEILSQLHEELWIASTKFDETKGACFDTWANLKLRDRAKRVISRKEGTHYSKTSCFSSYSLTNEDDEDAPMFEVADVSTVEIVVLERYAKKKADQRQLIDFLVHSGVPDAATIALVEAYLSAPPSASDTAIAKSIGIHHETVKRKLRKLARRYDANRFGDLDEYLAV
ncbi:hypothetical protein [Paenibacillus sp. SN-8-1]|uniref:hypothetical protein n=1 Tax=Paenibacillus sp. SN-8-1 TaxID=3435409 RepID=UPI003D9A0DF0